MIYDSHIVYDRGFFLFSQPSEDFFLFRHIFERESFQV